jgi:hypothetical protein
MLSYWQIFFGHRCRWLLHYSRHSALNNRLFCEESQKHAKKSLWKLCLINALFIILNCLEPRGCMLLFDILPFLKQIFFLPGEKCVILNEEQLKDLSGTLIFLQVWYFLIVARMTVDPIANIFNDVKMRTIVKRDILISCFYTRSATVVPSLSTVTVK